MSSDNNVEATVEVEAATAAENATVTSEQRGAPQPLAGPSSNPSGGKNIRPQETPKITRDVRITPYFPWSWPDQWVLERDFQRTYGEKEKGGASERIVETVKQYSDEMVKRWRAEIDNLLVYAGLFSAVMTVFIVQSYHLLQPSTPDPTLLMLQQISQQLNSFSVTQNGAFINSTHPVSFMPIQASPVEPWAIWLNSLWFSGLIFSLASTLMGIMVKQWIYEYQKGVFGDSLDMARLRQYRLNGLEKWHVAEIIVFLPVLLQVAFFLFFSGLLVLLWHYHSTVAIVASVLVGIVALFVVGTTIMPLMWQNCCYLSPPFYLMFSITQHTCVAFVWLTASFGMTSLSLLEIAHGNFGPMQEIFQAVHGLMDYLGVKPHTWRSCEQWAVFSSSSTLDVDMAIHAYSTSIDTKRLSDARVFLANHSPDAIQHHYTEVKKIYRQRYGPRINQRRFVGQQDPEVPSVDFWSSQFFYSIPVYETNRALEYWVKYDPNCNSRSPSTYHRLLLALVTAMTKVVVNPGIRQRSVDLLEWLFTSNPDALKLMPWNAVQHVATAMKIELCRLLYCLDHGFGQEVDWTDVSKVLRILERCCFAPVSSWERSPEDMRACMNYILQLTCFQKESLRENASKMDNLATNKMLQTLTLILTRLGDSADAWGCRPAAEKFMEAAQTVMEIVKRNNDAVLKDTHDC